MLRPSYSELMQILNEDPNLDNKITSRYAVVIAASKRARQLIDGAEPHSVAATNKAVSIAVVEMQDRLIKIIPDGDAKIEEPDDPELKHGIEYYNDHNFLESGYPKNEYVSDEPDADEELLEDDGEFGDGEAELEYEADEPDDDYDDEIDAYDGEDEA